MKKRSHRATIKVDTLEKIENLREKEFTNNKIADFIGVSNVTVGRYVRVLEALKRGEAPHVPTMKFCESVVMKYCDKHGIRYISPVEKEPDQMRLDIVSASDLAKKTAVELIGEEIAHLEDTKAAMLDAVLAFYDRLEQYMTKLQMVLQDINATGTESDVKQHHAG